MRVPGDIPTIKRELQRLTLLLAQSRAFPGRQAYKYEQWLRLQLMHNQQHIINGG